MLYSSPQNETLNPLFNCRRSHPTCHRGFEDILVITPHVTYPGLIKRDTPAQQRETLEIECLVTFDRVLEGGSTRWVSPRPPSPSLARPGLRKEDVRSKRREARGSVDRCSKFHGAHERNVHTRKHPPRAAPPLRDTHSARRIPRFAANILVVLGGPSPRCLPSHPSTISRTHIYISPPRRLYAMYISTGGRDRSLARAPSTNGREINRRDGERLR